MRQNGTVGNNLRTTASEDSALKALIRHFEDKGYECWKTQIIRIALNYMLHDFEQRSDDSVIAGLLDHLNNY